MSEERFKGRRRLPDLYSVAEVSAALGISAEFVRRHVKQGDFGQVIQFGSGRLRIPYSGIERFLSKSAVGEDRLNRLTAARFLS